MRIGLYGLPTAGKTFVLNDVLNFEVLSGSSLLNELAPDFQNLSESEKNDARVLLASTLKQKDNFIMDGHYSFGDNIVFTDSDGQLYDAIIYLYVDPNILTKRMEDSARNRKYLKYDIEKWQRSEVESLRAYCHENNKDFYVADNPEKGYFADTSLIVEFINSIACGFSCVKYAKGIASEISKSKTISLIDGDRTFINEDSCALIGYKTHIFDGNYYTGFQSWRHHRILTDYLKYIDYAPDTIDELDLTINEDIQKRIVGLPVILTTGNRSVWKQIADKYNTRLYCGDQMSSDTKFFVTKFVQEQASKVVAFGDSMNDYYMLKQADTGFLVMKKGGVLSKSLIGRDLEGLVFV